MKTFVALILGFASTAAMAATEAEIKAAFAKAQKKGAVAVMEERCGGTTGVWFPGATPQGMAKTAAALAALAAVGLKEDEPAAHCSAGLHDGDTRMLDLYPDGSVKAH